MPARDLRREGRRVDFDALRVDGVCIRCHRVRLGGAVRFQPCKSLLVGFQQSGFGAELRGVVRKRHAIVDVHRRHRLADIFQRAVIRAFRTQPAEHRQCHVLRPHPRLQYAFQLNANRFGHAEPELARHHDRGDIGAFDAGAERVEGAISRAMRVGTDDEIAACEVPAFGKHLVADAVAHIVEQGAALVAETPHRHVNVRRFGVGRWRVMIEHESRARCIRQIFRAELLELRERVTGPRVVDHREVDVRDDDFTRSGGAAGVSTENFFGERVAQWKLRDVTGEGCSL
jgi:hypothetical protein